MNEQMKQEDLEKIEGFARLMRMLNENKQWFPPKILATYSGQYVAWAPDGASIVAHASDCEALDQLVIAAGLQPSRCFYVFIDDLPAI